MRPLQLLLILLPNFLFGQKFIPVDTLQSYSGEITTKLNGQIESVVQVDFTGDGIKDYLVTMKSTDKHNFEYLEYWLTSDFQTFKKKKKYNEGIQYFRFVNLDKDPEPEIYSAYGYEDGIDYCFFDLDMKLGKEKLIFCFNPVIIESGNEHWGYPWDIEDLMVKNLDSEIQLYASIDHKIERYGEITIPENQKILPVIYFTGHSTQPNIQVGEVQNQTWMTIEELKKSVQQSIDK